MKIQSKNNNLYGFPQPVSQSSTPPIVQDRGPTPQDTGFSIGQIWIWKYVNSYILIGVSGGLANWQQTTNNYITNQIQTTDATPTIIYVYNAPQIPTANTLTFSIVAVSHIGSGSLFFYGTILVSTDGTTLTIQQLTNLVDAQSGDLSAATFFVNAVGNSIQIVIIGVASTAIVDWSLQITENSVS
jgi:hypothetical protein